MYRYIAFNKPFQVLSQFSPEGDKKTLSDFFPGLPKDIYPVGRLDYDSEGLLLLTNDKEAKHKLLEPRFAHKRTYLVQIEGIPAPTALQQLASGVFIKADGKNYKTRPAVVTLLDTPPAVTERVPPIRFRKHIPTSWLELTLTEGKNRQVRKMTAAIGFPTLRLIRYAIGNIILDAIAPGSYIELERF